MIALDTKVLLRILLDDDPKQSRQAQAILASAARSVTPRYQVFSNRSPISGKTSPSSATKVPVAVLNSSSSVAVAP